MSACTARQALEFETRKGWFKGTQNFFWAFRGLLIVYLHYMDSKGVKGSIQGLGFRVSGTNPARKPVKTKPIAVRSHARRSASSQVWTVG